LPPNIKVIEFFFLGRPLAARAVRAAALHLRHYTHAASYLLARGLNVVTQLVAKRVVDGVARYSLSCNTDTTLDILRARGEGHASFRLIGQVNSELPFMPGEGDLAADEIFRCSRQSRDRLSIVRAARRGRSATPNTPSDCMPRAWCATAARCRSASGRSAMRWRRGWWCATATTRSFTPS